MKPAMLVGTVALLAGSLIAADSRDEIAAAAAKLAASRNYSWTATTDLGPNSQVGRGTTEGKVDGMGYIWLSFIFNDKTTEAIRNGDKVAVKMGNDWQVPSETESAAGNPATYIGRRMRSLKPPAVEVQELLSNVHILKKDGDVYGGELTKRAARERLAVGFPRRGGGPGQGADDAKGSVKFWIQDGALTKYQTCVTGKRQFNGEEREIERIVTVEIKDLGTAKVTVPDEAKKKLD